MTPQFQITHGLQENTSRYCRGCINDINRVRTADTPQPIYLIITRLDSFGNKTNTVDSYCLNCAIGFYQQKENELAGQQKLQELKKQSGRN